ncbi:MAG: hypothetical protein HYY17_09120 [Planctomycetes bacterium]|nr:hypothetical protein [Planctomycetota bacterium]
MRRARPADAARIVGVVSQYGTRNNDDRDGLRARDPAYVNVGLLGQLPVLVTNENGPIKPGDPLTLSPKWRGRAVKATGPCRIIGYALTHFPYVEGEVTWPDDSSGSREDRLTGDHVKCFLSPGWYVPAAEAGDGQEPPAQPTYRDAIRRMDEEAARREKESK